IDRANVSLDKGEMSFRIFDYSQNLEAIISSSSDPIATLRELQRRIGDDAIPDYLIRYIQRTMPGGSSSVAIHSSSSIEKYTDREGLNKELIERKKGFFGQTHRDYPDAIHHLKIFSNAANRARMFYKFNGSITFIQNLKHV